MVFQMCTVCCFTSWIVNGELRMPVPSCQDLFSPKGCEALDALAEQKSQVTPVCHQCVLPKKQWKTNDGDDDDDDDEMFSEFHCILGGWGGGDESSCVLLFIFILYNYVSWRPLERWQTWLNRVSRVQSTWSQWSAKTTIAKLSIEMTLTKAQWLKPLNAQHAQQVWVVVGSKMVAIELDTHVVVVFAFWFLKHWFMLFYFYLVNWAVHMSFLNMDIMGKPPASSLRNPTLACCFWLIPVGKAWYGNLCEGEMIFIPAGILYLGRLSKGIKNRGEKSRLDLQFLFLSFFVL